MGNTSITRGELLLKPIWNNQDIMYYCGCASTKAVEIHQRAVEIGGQSNVFPKCVKRNYVLKVLETSIEQELKIKELIGGKQNGD